MRRSAALATALLLGALLLRLGAPVCVSDSCPKSAAQRVDCRAMGGDCCQPQVGALSHPSPQAPALAPALAPGRLPTLDGGPRGAADRASSPLDATPAVVSGVGLFTLLAVFRL